MDEAILRMQVLTHFNALTQTIETLCDALISENISILWTQDTSHVYFPFNLTCHKEKTVALLKQLTYLDDQSPREIIICAGFIGVSENIIALAQIVNKSKDSFKKSILALKVLKMSQRAALLKSIGLSRIHLKQCYRKIPILAKAPHKISWTWAHTRAIKKISHSTAQSLLMKKGQDVGIQIQLQKLNQLSGHESLAIVQELAPHLRANIVFNGPSHERMMLKGPIPLFFPCDDKTAFPEFTIPRKKELRNQNRLTRSDVKLEPQPFLPAIRAHRYTT